MPQYLAIVLTNKQFTIFDDYIYFIVVDFQEILLVVFKEYVTSTTNHLCW